MKSKLPNSLTNLQKTLLITLYGKALESKHAGTILSDRFAVEAIERVDFDFSKLKLSRNALVALAVRAKVFDEWTESFLETYAHANVVHLGCGLDSRFLRLNPSRGVTWWEVDFPEVIQLRKEVYEDREGIQLLGGSLLERDWLKKIPPDRPTFIVAEGVLPYFDSQEAMHVLRNLVDHFQGGQIAFDAYNRWGIWWLNQLPIMKQTHEKLYWAIDNPRQLEEAIPELRLRIDNTEGLPQYVPRAGAFMRTLFHCTRKISPFRRMGQLLLFDFGRL